MGQQPEEESAQQAFKLFYCYAREDQALRDKLDKHLAGLHRSNLITGWYDAMISPGLAWEKEIDTHLNAADIILLLITADFIHSDYCYSYEMSRAIERHLAGEARVIPILLRSVDWIDTPFSKIQMLPTGAQPVTMWPDPDAAFTNIAHGIRRIVKQLMVQRQRLTNVPTPVQQFAPEPIADKLEQLLSNQSFPGEVEVLSRRDIFIGVSILLMGGGMLLRSRVGVNIQLSTSRFLHPANYAYNGHLDYVQSVAWSPDGLRIASASYDRTVQVWNAADGSSPFTYRGHSNYVQSVAWSPDGLRVASASFDNTVHVWNAANASSRYIYRGHSNVVIGVAWSPDGTYIASAGGDHTVQIWHTTNGSALYIYQGHSNKVNAVAWSPDGLRIASASSDNTVHVWNAANGSALYIYQGHSNKVNAVAWSPDGLRIASASSDNTVHVWRAAGDSSSPYIYQGHTSYVQSVTWSPDGERIASAGFDNTVRIWISPNLDTHSSSLPMTYHAYINYQRT